MNPTTLQGPELDAYIQGIFERKYYANHGPLESAAQQAIAAAAGTRYAVLVANQMWALVLALRAAGDAGTVWYQSHASGIVPNAIAWSGWEGIPIDGIEDAARVMNFGSSAACRPRAVICECSSRAVTAAKSWPGHANHPPRLIWLVRTGGSMPRQAIGPLDAIVYGFAGEQSAAADDAGAVATDDETVWKRLRTMRSFHESETCADDCLRFNGKASELQAALVLARLKA